MGFIEDEKRKYAERQQKGQQRYQSFLKQQEEEQEQAKILKELEEAERLDRTARGKEAERQYEQSGLSKMITELGKIGSHHKEWSGHAVDDYYRKNIVVSEGSKHNKEVLIKVVSDGTIAIQGGLFGSTILPKDEWQGENGREALEKALGKAYRHPMFRPGTYIDRSRDDTPLHESYPGN